MPLFCHLASSRDEPLVSRIAASLGPEEKASIVAALMSVEGDAFALTPALAECTALTTRHWTWPLDMKRAQASRFLEWCRTQGIDPVQERLPYGCVARSLQNHDLLPGT